MLDPRSLRAALASWPVREVPALPGRRNDRPAGVLVPLSLSGTMLLTVRSKALREHRGEIAFPGGKPEPQDEHLAATSLREAKEELDLDAVVLGPLSSVPLFTSEYRLAPHLALFEAQPLRANDEVAEILELDLQALLARDHIDAIPFEAWGAEHLSPVFELGQHTCFGATAHVLWEAIQLVSVSLGRPAPPLKPGRLGWADLGIT